jgi:hypothetical protein
MIEASEIYLKLLRRLRIQDLISVTDICHELSICSFFLLEYLRRDELI